MSSFGDQKPKIEYPCSWNYKVIGTNKAVLVKTVSEILNDPFDLSPSKISEKGKYISLNLYIEVQSESHRDGIYKSLKASEQIKMVM
jgi:uncharacterized protein